MASARAWPRKPAASFSSAAVPRAAHSSRRNPRDAGQHTSTADRTSDSARPGARFGRDRRLTEAQAFSRVFDRARRSRDHCFTVLYRPNGQRAARLGLAIAKKNCRRAVARNRLKRIIRESFRRQQAALRGLDIVVMNKPGAENRRNAELFESLAAHWARLAADPASAPD